MRNLLLFSTIFLFAATSCKQKHPLESGIVASPANQEEIDNNAIIRYIIDSLDGKEFKKTDSGIYYAIENEGTGKNPQLADMVTTHYKGTFLDGKQFDSSYDRGEPATFPLGQVVKGWQEAIPLLKIGGKGTFIIPSGLAYGAQGRPGMPPNSVLAFDVELIDIFDQEKQKEKDEEIIAKYVADNKLDMKKTDSGIYYTIEKTGKGKNPTLENSVVAHYKGTFLDGKQFDSSYDRGEPTSFPLTGVVKGWQEAIPLLKPGGKGKFIIPSGLAYGPMARPGIPANSVLIFDVELKEVK